MRNKTLTVALFEFKRTAMRKAFLISTFLIPFLWILTMAIYLHIGQDDIPGPDVDRPIGFVDRSDLFNPSEGFAEFSGTGPAREALMRDELALFFVVHEDYLATANITVYSMDSALLDRRQTVAIQSFILKGLLKKGNLGEELSERIEAPMSAGVIELDERGDVKEDDENTIDDVLLPVLINMLVMMGIINSSGDLRRGIIEEKERRTGEILLSSISAEQLLSGKILGYGCTGLLQVLIQALVWILIGLVAMSRTDLGGFLGGVEYSWLIGLAIVYFVLGYFLYATSIACAAAISSSAKQAENVSSIFTFFLIIPMMFQTVIIMAPDSLAARTMTLFPYTAPFITMMRLSLGKVPPIEIIVNMTILIVSITLLSWLSGRIFRMGLLMTGKKASLREIAGYVIHLPRPPARRSCSRHTTGPIIISGTDTRLPSAGPVASQPW